MLSTFAKSHRSLRSRRVRWLRLKWGTPDTMGCAPFQTASKILGLFSRSMGLQHSGPFEWCAALPQAGCASSTPAIFQHAARVRSGCHGAYGRHRLSDGYGSDRSPVITLDEGRGYHFNVLRCRIREIYTDILHGAWLYVEYQL